MDDSLKIIELCQRRPEDPKGIVTRPFWIKKISKHKERFWRRSQDLPSKYSMIRSQIWKLSEFQHFYNSKWPTILWKGEQNNLILKDAIENCVKKEESKREIRGKMMERMKKYPCNVARLSANSESNLGGIGDMTSVLGSAELVTFPGHNAGFLSTVLEAYNRHYNLRTGPEDWWYTIIQTVSLAIEK